MEFYSDWSDRSTNGGWKVDEVISNPSEITGTEDALRTDPDGVWGLVKFCEEEKDPTAGYICYILMPKKSFYTSNQMGQQKVHY